MSRVGNRPFEELRSELSGLLGAEVSVETLEGMIQQESAGRLNNAVSRAIKGESGAMQFLRNCFPTEDIRGRRQQAHPSLNSSSESRGQEHHHSQDEYPMPDDDAFPADTTSSHDNQSHRHQRTSVHQQDRRQCGGEGGGVPSFEQSAQGDRREEYLDHHVYGSKGALCVQANFKEKHGLHTIAVDAASSAGIRKYAWDKKIRLQLTQSELPEFFAVVAGMAPYCKLNNHGAGNNKALEIRDQGDSLFVQVYGPGQSVSVKILPSDTYYVSQIIMRQMLRNAPWLDSVGLMSLVRSVVANRMPMDPKAQQGHRYQNQR